MRFPQALLTATALAALAACGDLSEDLDRAKQSAAEFGQEALNAGADVLDTRSACLLAGQSMSFCTCLSERLGPDITAEHVQALTDMVRATVNGENLQSAAEAGAGVDTQSREAVIHCAARAAVDGAINEAGN